MQRKPVRKSTGSRSRLFVRVCLICLMVTGLIIGTLWGYSYLNQEKQTDQVDQEAAKINQLEKLYLAKDYSAITGMVRTEELYTGRFGKYWQIADVCYYQEIMNEYYDTYKKDTTGDAALLKKYLEYMINYGCISLKTARSYLTGTSDYGNKEVLQELADQQTAFFTDTLQFSSEELGALLVITDGSKIADYAELAYERMN